MFGLVLPRAGWKRKLLAPYQGVEATELVEQ